MYKNHSSFWNRFLFVTRFHYMHLLVGIFVIYYWFFFKVNISVNGPGKLVLMVVIS